MSQGRTLPWILAILVLAQQTATASIFVKYDVHSLTRKSAAVVHARVIDMESSWNESRTSIFTNVTLAVLGTLYGEAGSSVVVQVPGGSLDGYRIVMDGAPTFRRDEEVVVFLARDSHGAIRVPGYYQGVARVVRDGKGARLLRGGVADGLTLTELEDTLRTASE